MNSLTLKIISRRSSQLTSETTETSKAPETPELTEIESRAVRALRSELAGQASELADIDPSCAAELSGQASQLADVDPALAAAEAPQGLSQVLADGREGLLDVDFIQVQVVRHEPLGQRVEQDL